MTHEEALDLICHTGVTLSYQEAIEGYLQLRGIAFCDRDAARSAATACLAPVPKDQQARAACGIAKPLKQQPKSGSSNV